MRERGSSPEDRERGVRLVKLGGSLITDKERRESARPEVIRRLARETAASLGASAGDGLVIGHGSGSFGHPAAARHGITGSGEARAGRRPGPRGISDVQGRAAELHRRVVAALREAGVPVFSVAPSASAVARDGAVEEWFPDPLAAALESGLVPVVYGDVLLDRDRGAVVVSTETVLGVVIRGLAGRGWTVKGVLWLGATAGVLDGRGRSVERLDAAGETGLGDALGGSEGTDVTGGMAHRVATARELAAVGVPSWISDGRRPGLLREWLESGRAPGTRVVPGERA